MITLVSIMQDEAPIIDRWVEGWRRPRVLTLSEFYEIVVLDGGSKDDTVKLLRKVVTRVVEQPFEGDFGEQRNALTPHTTSNWLFHLDADEMPSIPLLTGLRDICGNADKAGVDCVGIPRLNFHDYVLQSGVGARGLDYQYRLHRRHCHWKGIVHEEVVGYKARVELDIGDGHFIQHLKTSERHLERNEMYQKLEGRL